MPNRLAHETSPYLQQHAANPVDWYPWGEEARERARREDKPILLSVGYSACHWCHVMAHESFEDPAVAALMNRLFVNVKVDREERPDLDQIYQSAHQMLAQRPGGWPLTMFLSPGSAPKFPHPTDLELCLRKGETDIAHTTLKRMCEGGIYDQLGGGFSRYSVDAQWMIPHFEKMLYDNGPLLALLADAWLVTGDPLYARCAEETAGWIMREMQSPEGGYYSSLDADSEHEEGKFYVWSRDEAQSALTGEEYAVLSPHFGLDQPPNFENRHWHLHVARPVEPGKEGILEKARQKLFAAREKRVRPGRDEKVLVSWNALAIRGMAHAGRVFGREPWLASARLALDFIRNRMWHSGRLLATYKDGRAHLNAYLDDYAFLLAALLELVQADFAL